MVFKGNYGKYHPKVLTTKVLFGKMANISFYQPRDVSPFKAYYGEYALCTTASCTRLSNGILACSCDIRNGNAVGINTPKNFTPFNLNGNQYLWSLYSGVNSNQIVKQTCDRGTWGDCLNRLCVKTGPYTATCYCLPETNNPWITFQYKNDKSPCRCNNLSGALNNAYINIENFYKNLG